MHCSQNLVTKKKCFPTQIITVCFCSEIKYNNCNISSFSAMIILQNILLKRQFKYLYIMRFKNKTFTVIFLI